MEIVRSQWDRSLQTVIGLERILGLGVCNRGGIFCHPGEGPEFASDSRAQGMRLGLSPTLALEPMLQGIRGDG